MPRSGGIPPERLRLPCTRSGRCPMQYRFLPGCVIVGAGLALACVPEPGADREAEPNVMSEPPPGQQGRMDAGAERTTPVTINPAARDGAADGLASGTDTAPSSGADGARASTDVGSVDA